MRKIKNKIKLNQNVGQTTVKNCLDNYLEDFIVDMKFEAQDLMFYNSLPLYDFFDRSYVKTLSVMSIRYYKSWGRDKFREKWNREIANNTLGRELTLLKSALNLAIGEHKDDPDG